MLSIHSWLRWILLAVVLFALVHALTQRNHQRGLVRATVSLMDLQVLLGLFLYGFLSPFMPKSGEAFRGAMKDSMLRFWAVEHLVSAILALVAVHVGSVAARRAPDAARAQKRWAIGLGVGLLFLLATVPWPFLPYGRSLFRM
ncbi:MAG: hypothetical protein ACKVPX_01915 [Myxococcaceae bacterium]